MQSRIFSLLLLIFLALPAWAQAEKVALIFVSGIAEIRPGENDSRGGLAELSTLLTELRKNEANLLFFHGGAALAPSVLSTIDKGAHMIGLLNLLEPDLMAVAKSEFTHKEDELTLRTFEAAFPLISTNTLDPLTGKGIEGIYPYRLIKSGSYTLGVMALVDPEVISDYLPSRARVLETEEVVRQTAQIMRQQGADMIVFLADFRPNKIDHYLAESIIDYAIISDSTITADAAVNRSNYHEFPKYTGNVCRIDLELNGRGDSFHWYGRSSMVQLEDYIPDPAILSKIHMYLDKLDRIHSSVIGTTATAIDTRRRAVRTRENGFGNLLADILRNFYQADVALINGGGIRGDREYPANTSLTRGDIHRELPFNNRITQIIVSGAQLWSALENGLSRIEDVKGRFPHISGIRVTYDPSLETLHRVIDVTIAGKPLAPQKVYTLATLDYIASGGDGYTMFKNCERQVKIGGGKMLWEYVRNFIVTSKSISPDVDGRLKAINERTR